MSPRAHSRIAGRTRARISPQGDGGATRDADVKYRLHSPARRHPNGLVLEEEHPGRRDRRPSDPSREVRHRFAVHHPPAPGVLNRSRSVPTRALPRWSPVRGEPLQLPAVRRRATSMHGRPVRSHRSPNRACRAGGQVQATSRSRPRRSPGSVDHASASGRHADDDRLGRDCVRRLTPLDVVRDSPVWRRRPSAEVAFL